MLSQRMQSEQPAVNSCCACSLLWAHRGMALAYNWMLLELMGHHDVYTALVDAVAKGSLKEPFSAADFRHACPGFGEGTYRAFLWKHSATDEKNTRLLEKVAPGKFRLARPLRYGVEEGRVSRS